MPDFEPLLRKFRKEPGAGTGSLALLAAALGPMYGYQIDTRLERTGEGVPAGKRSALHPVLHNLEAAALPASRVETSLAGPPRRYYRITDAGRFARREWVGARRAARGCVGSVLEGLRP